VPTLAKRERGAGAMTEQEVQQINAAWQESVKRALLDVELRKWCIEKSSATASAKDIYDFVTASLQELLKTENQELVTKQQQHANHESSERR
jgi:hypothetical protein